MLNDYINLIQLQRQKNKLYQKDYRILTLPRQNLTAAEAFNNFNKFPNAFLSNVIYRDFLYKNNEENYFYEFVDKGVGYNTTLEDWRFFYIPLSYYSNIISRLPSFKYYDINQGPFIQNYNTNSSFMYLDSGIKTKNYYLLNTNSNNYHPLLPHFMFTGKIMFSKQGKAVYEYKDIKGYSDDETILYLSFLPPNEVKINSFIVLDSQFDTVTYDLDNPPEKLLFLNSEDENLDLRFTGRITNQNFSKVKKWYEYSEYINGFPFNQIILPNSPTDSNLGFIKIQLFNKTKGLAFNNVTNEQNLSINQNSQNKQIKL